MKYHYLVEKPDNSNTWVPTGEVVDDKSLEEVRDECVMRTQLGMGRTAVFFYEALNLRPTGSFVEPAAEPSAPVGRVHFAEAGIAGETNTEHG